MTAVRWPVRRRAFTLIEMIVALVLATLMMAGLLTVVSSIAIESNQLSREQTDFISAAVLADRLRDDFVNARGMLIDRDSITLAGWLSAQNLPAQIRYEVVMAGKERCLVRRSDERTEACWLGFGGFEYEPYEVIDDQTPIAEMAGGLPAVPSRFRISARDVRGQTLFSQTIDHHAH